MSSLELESYGPAIVRVAESYLGSKEVGNNGGPLVERLLEFVGIHRPAPWCTAAAVNILHEAATSLGGASTCPRVASGAKLWRWALHHPSQCLVVRSPRDLEPGDVVIQGATVGKANRIRAGRLASGHTWLAGTHAYGDEGYHASFEGNTNLAGSREGQGFYARTRLFEDPRVVGAIRFRAILQLGRTR